MNNKKILNDMELDYSLKNNIHFKRYKNFILSRKEDKTGYVERHHIYPKSLCSHSYINESTNLIRLSAREHYIAHMILWKAIKGKMTNAFLRIVNCKKDYGMKINSRQYEELRKDFAIYSSKMNTGRKRPQSAIIETANKNRGKRRTDELKRKMSIINKGQKHSKEQDEKQRNFVKGRIWVKKGTTSKQILKSELKKYLENGYIRGRYLVYTEEALKKISESSKNRKASKETKQIYSKQRKGRIAVHKGNEKRKIKKEELEDFLKNGYTLNWKD